MGPREGGGPSEQVAVASVAPAIVRRKPESIRSEIRILRESEAMLAYALGKGLQPSSSVALSISRARTIIHEEGVYALSKPTPELKNIPTTEPLTDLINAHKSLAALLAPAKPRSVAFIQEATDGNDQRIADTGPLRRPLLRLWYGLGPIPVARQLSVAGFLFLALFIVGLVLTTRA